MKALITFTLILFCFRGALAQVYVEGGKTRHRFAQLNLGIDYRFFSGNGTTAFRIGENGQSESYTLADLHESRFIIGGTHFWGHADFFIGIPLFSNRDSEFRTRVETGFKIFPWRIENRKIRPYFGASWMPTKYHQGEGANQWRSRYPITSGLVFNHKNHLLDLGIGYLPNNKWEYHISNEQSATIEAQKLWISISYKHILETTLSAEKDWLSGRTQKLTDTLASLNRLNGLTFAIGPSTAFFSRKSEHVQAVAPYADQHKASNLFMEFGMGYYLHKPDIQFNLAYRNVKSKIEAFDFQQNANRRALTLETYKFFADYHGFVPFVGPSLSVEMLKVEEMKNNVTNSESATLVRPGLTFGWDIRPNRIQSWYLRTNLRYFPAMNLHMSSGQKMRFDQWEFNFIQLVLFPGRMF